MCDKRKPWFYAGPYVPSGVIYGESDWPNYSHMLVPGFDPDPPINAIDIYPDLRIVGCQACGTEGRVPRTVWVYEHGCGFAHQDVYLGEECPICEGTGGEIVEVEPIEMEDLERI